MSQRFDVTCVNCGAEIPGAYEMDDASWEGSRLSDTRYRCRSCGHGADYSKADHHRGSR